MSKADNLRDYLSDLYEGIVSKKSGASRQPQNFRSEIESLRLWEECEKPHVIEVGTLPTENIDESAVYLCGGAYHKYEDVFVNIVKVENGEVFLLQDDSEDSLTFHIIPTKTTEGVILFDFATPDICNFYYIEDEEDCFVCFLSSETGEITWTTLSSILGLTNGGVISDISGASGEGVYYALMNKRFVDYRHTEPISIYNGEVEVY